MCQEEGNISHGKRGSKSHRRHNDSKKTKRKPGPACQWFFWILHVVVDTIIDFIFRRFIVDFDNKKQIPPIKHPFLVESASSLAGKIRSKQVSSEELVKCCIQRIEEVNSSLNCVVDQRFNEALEEAKKVDDLIASGKLSVEELKRQKPFLGVPFTSKESTNAAGMSNTYGLVARKGSKATEDAVIIERMKEGGAILLAVTNIPELNLWQETRNNVFGQTNNPYNLNRTVGGSSGGEAAAIAACASPFGLGTDIGGSIRMPSYFCGIFGHKITTGIISTKGLTFRTGKEKERTMVSVGPMTRYAEDLTPCIKLLMGEEVNQLKLDSTVDLSKVNVCYVTDPGDRRVSVLSGQVKSVMQRSVDHLEDVCSAVEQLSLPGLSYSYTLWRYWMSKEPGNFALMLGNTQYEVSVFTELPKMLVGQSEFTLPTMLKILESSVFPAVPAQWAEELTEKLRTEILDKLGDNGVMLLPSHPTTANYHYVPFFRPFNFAYWAIFNVLGFPCTQVPLGLDKDGLPIGIQVASAPYNDHLCIAVAQELERALGGYVAPCEVTK